MVLMSGLFFLLHTLSVSRHIFEQQGFVWKGHLSHSSDTSQTHASYLSECLLDNLGHIKHHSLTYREGDSYLSAALVSRRTRWVRPNPYEASGDRR